MSRRVKCVFEASQAGLWQQLDLLRADYLQRRHFAFRLVENYSELIPGRKFQVDVALPDLKIGAEYQGGDFMRKSGHTNVKGLARDRYKLNHAQLNGWILFQFGAAETESGEAMILVERAIELRRRQS